MRLFLVALLWRNQTASVLCEMFIVEFNHFFGEPLLGGGVSRLPPLNWRGLFRSKDSIADVFLNLNRGLLYTHLVINAFKTQQQVSSSSMNISQIAVD